MRSLLKLVIVFFLFISSAAWSQEIKTTRDIGYWIGVGLDYKLNKKWTTSASQELRTFDNATKLSGAITEFGIRYKINKQFRLGAGLRYAYDRQRDLTFLSEARYNLDFKFKQKIVKHLQLHYRFRFQNNYSNIFSVPNAFEPEANIRNRVKFQYKLKDHTLFFATELFRSYEFFRMLYFNSLRFSVGNKRETKLGDFNYGFAYERELNEVSPLNFFFLKLNYTFNFKRKKRND